MKFWWVLAGVVAMAGLSVGLLTLAAGSVGTVRMCAMAHPGACMPAPVPSSASLSSPR